MQLTNTFAPLDDEDGLGYYRRLSAENGFQGWRQLARLCELPVSRSGLLSRPETVAERLGLPAAWAEQATAQEDVARGWTGLRRIVRDAVCPQCLHKRSYLRSHWEHSYVVACPEHKVLLSDACEACGQPLSVHRDQILLCACGQDLSAMSTRPATAAQLWVSALVASGGRSSGSWSPAIIDTCTDIVVALVRTLCLLYDPQVPPPRQNTGTPRSVAQSVAFLKPLDALLSDWPAGFEAHVSARIAAGNPEARTLNSLLGKWYRQLAALATSSTLAPFLEAVGRVAAKEFNGLIGLDSAAPVMAKQGSHMLAAQAAKRIGMHRDTLVSRIKSGQVRYRTRKFGTRGLAYEVPLVEVEAIVRARSGWVNEAQACEMLAVPASVLARMVEAGLVESDSEWWRDVRKGGPISCGSIAQLGARLRSYRVAGSSEEGGRISLRDLTGRRVGDKKAICSALRAIAIGDVKPVFKAELPGNMQYPLAQVALHFSTPVLDAGLSVQGLSKLTGWKWESISHWIELGLLESNSIMLRGQPCRVVMPAQLLDFCREYIPLADLAKQLDSKSSAIAEKLQAVDVIGARPLANGQRRGGLVRIADMACLVLGMPGRAAHEQRGQRLCADPTEVAQIEQPSCYTAQMQQLHPRRAGTSADRPSGDKEP